MKQLTLDLASDLPIGKSRFAPRTVYDFYIDIDGKEYDLGLLWSIMEDEDEYDLRDTEIGEMLLKLDVFECLNTALSSPEPGPNFEKFKQIIDDQMESMRLAIKD